jgi:serine/threonine protein phosphatase 1
MRYIIGDIHSEITKLERLFQVIEKSDKFPELIFIGDYIDKGEDARATLDFLVKINEKYRSVFILGNHEYCWRQASEFEDYLLTYGGKHTMASFRTSNVMDTQKLLFEEYSGFLKSLVDYVIIDNYFIAHSGIPPELYLTSNPEEIDSVAYLYNRYPFIEHQAFFQNKYKVIFGHTSFFSPYVDPFKIGIDTGACYLKDQPLTAFRIEGEMFLNSKFEMYALEELNDLQCANIIRSKPYRTYA